MNLDKQELTHTKHKKLIKAVKILKQKEEWIPPKSTFDLAVETVIEYLEKNVLEEEIW